MSVIINFYGGPSCGKSTGAALLFAHLKNLGLDAELIQEYAKEFAWQKREPTSLDQFHFFGEQSRREVALLGKVDYIVTDSPIPLCSFYTTIYGTDEQKKVFPMMVDSYYNIVEESGHKYVHVWLNRVKPYNPKGRFQSEQEAKDIDEQMKTYMKDMLGIEFIEVNGDKDGVESLVATLR